MARNGSIVCELIDGDLGHEEELAVVLEHVGNPLLRLRDVDTADVGVTARLDPDRRPA